MASKFYKKWWFWVGILIIITSIFLTIYFTQKTIPTSSDNKQSVQKNDSVLCVHWEDMYRLEQKDNGIDITMIGIINKIRFEDLVDSKEYYRTGIELEIFDKTSNSHYITVMYNRPYNSPKVIEKDHVWVYGTYQYPNIINANNIEVYK